MLHSLGRLNIRSASTSTAEYLILFPITEVIDDFWRYMAHKHILYAGLSLRKVMILSLSLKFTINMYRKIIKIRAWIQRMRCPGISPLSRAGIAAHFWAEQREVTYMQREHSTWYYEAKVRRAASLVTGRVCSWYWFERSDNEVTEALPLAMLRRHISDKLARSAMRFPQLSITLG